MSPPAPAAPPLSATARTRIGRKRDRARTDRADLHAVLDAACVCHLGVVIDGAPRVLPTAYGRDGDTLYLHGSTGASSLLAAPSAEICVTVTHVDGLVLARSVNHHSINYRSAVVYGIPRRVTGDAEKLRALRAIVENVAPGQWDAARAPSRKELASTAVLALPLDEASVKVREGDPVDEPEDYALDVWAGVVPVRTSYGAPVPDPALRPGIPVPGHILATFQSG
ncbi:pyridoxamine 5'-phosphate oxidase family protein [Actinomadura gamaensis]|uniref:Pyridoxamine 5'-phosphate oxidase family protein n=1 Tax=Actinomadura gamaensis TaxID=1763541 RepID=A0ABV9U4Q9_9ACTN